MLRRYQIENANIVETDDEKAPVLLFVNPDEAKRRRLVETYQIDEHTLISALDPDEQARLECEPNHIAFIYKRPKNYSGDDQLLFKASTMGVFYFGDLLILVLAEDTNLFEGKQLAKVGSVRELLIRLIYRAIYHFMEHLRIINTIADDVEQKINKAMENKYLINPGLQLAEALAGGASQDKSNLMALLGLGAQVGVILPFSRTQETEADLLGLDLMAKAGFDPRDSVDLWKNMMAASGNGGPAFLSPHPASTTRIKDLENRMSKAMPLYEQARARVKVPRCK